MIWGNVLLKVKKRGCQNKIKFTQRMRIINVSEGFFKPISRNKLCTEIKKEKKSQESKDTVKKDMQAFRLMVAKSVNMEDTSKGKFTEKSC